MTDIYKNVPPEDPHFLPWPVQVRKYSGLAGYTYIHHDGSCPDQPPALWIVLYFCFCLQLSSSSLPAFQRARVRRRFCFRLYDIAFYFLSELAWAWARAPSQATDSINMHARDLLGVHLIANPPVQCSLLAATSTPTPHTFGQHGGSPALLLPFPFQYPCPKH